MSELKLHERLRVLAAVRPEGCDMHVSREEMLAIAGALEMRSKLADAVEATELARVTYDEAYLHARAVLATCADEYFKTATRTIWWNYVFTVAVLFGFTVASWWWQ